MGSIPRPGRRCNSFKIYVPRHNVAKMDTANWRLVSALENKYNETDFAFSAPPANTVKLVSYIMKKTEIN